MSMLARFATTGGGVATYIEDVFSTFLYTGNGSTQTITNGIDLAGKGGLVWIKRRDATGDHTLTDTARGASNVLYSNLNFAQSTDTQAGAYSYLSNGFDVYSASGLGTSNRTGATYASWTFRKQAKFFDVVTYTGNGTNNRAIAHSLGSTPGFIVIKRTDAADGWWCYHRSMTSTNYYMRLDGTGAEINLGSQWIAVGSTTFSVWDSGLTCNVNGGTYVAYLFAHDAGGFGQSGSDNVITCGSYTGNGSTTGPTVTLGYEPQFLIIKRSTNGAYNWNLLDVFRGLSQTNTIGLSPNTNSQETDYAAPIVVPTAIGFTLATTASSFNANGETYIYIAIRRGPMKTPTTGTSVYNAIARTGTGADATVTGVGFTPDLVHYKFRDSGSWNNCFEDRLRGATKQLYSDLTNAETTTTTAVTSFGMDGISVGNSLFINYSTGLYINHFFRRAPGFFDVVCYTGTGSGSQTVTHNLSAVPELIITRARSSTDDWYTYSATVGNTKTLYLNGTAAASTASSNYWNNTSPTSTQFTAGPFRNGSATYVAYLFATCPGVSKVGSYTGTGNTLQIDCGFTGGARFVLIKRTDSTGDWYVWDSARGIVAGNDPYLLLNSAAAEVTTTDWVDTYSAGFELSNAGGNNANINTATYVFLAVA